MTGTATDRPAGVAAGDFRRILSRFATGVAVVSARAEGRPYGMAVNSFASVSLEPPLVSFCAARSSTTWPQVRRATGFTVSILGQDHEELCRLFARKDADRFGDGRGWVDGPSGHPVLADALAWLDCETVAVHRAGDHDLVLARVLAGDAREGFPLVFFGGRLTGVQG